jgi:hypothetical protein
VKRKMLYTAFSMLSLLFLIAIQFVDLGQANPFIRRWEKAGEIPPPEGTLPPIISITSPQNNTAYTSNNVSLTLNVSMPESNTVPLYISELYYVPSWKRGANSDLVKIDAPQGSISLEDVLEGPRWLEVYAVASAVAYELGYKIEGIYCTIYQVIYKITSSSLVEFIIDNTAPKVLSVSVENKTYSASDLPLNVIVNEPVSQIIYSLDGQSNRTVAGNTTLNDVSNGAHTLKIRVLDSAGNAGNLETLFFSVDVQDPSPTTMVIAPIALVSVIGSGLVFYFKKRKH